MYVLTYYSTSYFIKYIALRPNDVDDDDDDASLQKRMSTIFSFLNIYRNNCKTDGEMHVFMKYLY